MFLPSEERFRNKTQQIFFVNEKLTTFWKNLSQQQTNNKQTTIPTKQKKANAFQPKQTLSKIFQITQHQVLLKNIES